MTKMKNHKRHILLAVSGLNPQVVTETLYALAVQKNIDIAEIYIVTTAKGKQIIREGRSDDLSLRPLETEIERFCRLYDKPLPQFIPDGAHIIEADDSSLDDIVNEEANLLFADTVTRVIREMTAVRNTVLHCSLAGGRKTMSAAIAIAMTMFGRREDTLTHVLVSKEFEQSKKFFPETPEEVNQITLCEFPYVRLRDKLSWFRMTPTVSYADLVRRAQEEVNLLHVPAVAQLSKRMRTVTIGKDRIKSRHSNLPSASFTISIVPEPNSRFKFLESGSITHLFTVTSEFSRRAIQYELKNLSQHSSQLAEFYKRLEAKLRSLPANETLLRLGGGKTFLDNSIALALVDDEEAYAQYVKTCFGKGMPFPRTRSVLFQNGVPAVPLGWVHLGPPGAGAHPQAQSEQAASDPIALLSQKFRIRSKRS